jgi:hypothetical protein
MPHAQRRVRSDCWAYSDDVCTETVEALRGVAAGEHYVDWLQLRIRRKRSMDRPMSGSRLPRDDQFMCDAK